MCPQGGAREEPRVVAAEGGARFGPDAVTAACGAQRAVRTCAQRCSRGGVGGQEAGLGVQPCPPLGVRETRTHSVLARPETQESVQTPVTSGLSDWEP